MLECDQKVQLNLMCPMCATRPVIVRLSQPINILQKLFPNNVPHKFFYNGQVLHESHSFAFYDVKNQDAIIAIVNTKNSLEKSSSIWQKISKNNDTIKETISWATNTSTASEFYRLRDMNMNMIERKPNLFRKLCNSRIKYEETVAQSKSTSSNEETLYEKPKEIASSPLPCYWSK